MELFFTLCYLRSRDYNDLTIVETKMQRGGCGIAKFAWRRVLERGVTDSTIGTAGGVCHHAIPSAASTTMAAAAAVHPRREREPRSLAITGPLPDTDNASSAKARSDAD